MTQTPEELLQPFRPERDGPWDRAAAAHLVRRVAFGQPTSRVDKVEQLGPGRGLKWLLEPREESRESGLLRDIAYRSGSLEAVRGWWCYRMLFGLDSARDKLALFWHDHFATSNRKVNKPRLMQKQLLLFLEKGLGPFPELLLEVARDPAMVLWLDGNDNRKGQPNENFGRELLELFSLGIGNYTEEDIQGASRAFTGWHIRSDKFRFSRSAHDDGKKTFLGETGTFDGGDIVSICTRNAACRRFLATKLYHFYVNSETAPDLEEELGRVLAEVGMNTGAFLQRVLASRAFYASDNRRVLHSSPVDFAIGTLATLGGRADMRRIADGMGEMGLSLFQPPSVAGWQWGSAWFNTTSVLARQRFAAQLLRDGEWKLRLDWDRWTAIEVAEVIKSLFPDGLSDELVSDLVKATSADPRLLIVGCVQLPEYQMI